MSGPPIDYAQGAGVKPAPSRPAGVAFGCAAAATSGVLLTMYLIRHPIPGPAGGLIRGVLAPIFGVLVLLLWVSGITCAVVAGRRCGFRGMAAATLATCGVAVA